MVLKGWGFCWGGNRGTAPLPAKAELQWIWGTLEEGDGRAFLLIFLRDKAPLPILALVTLKVVSALSTVFAIV